MVMDNHLRPVCAAAAAARLRAGGFTVSHASHSADTCDVTVSGKVSSRSYHSKPSTSNAMNEFRLRTVKRSRTLAAATLGPTAPMGCYQCARGQFLTAVGTAGYSPFPEYDITSNCSGTNYSSFIDDTVYK